ncbi:glycogen-binding domain-containing protein [bacterium]|nr:glycogen-binding domain-containing protein [bacterium]
MMAKRSFFTILLGVVLGSFLTACAGSVAHRVVIPDPDARWKSVEIVSTEVSSQGGANQLLRTSAGDWQGRLVPQPGAMRVDYRLRAVSEDGTSLFFPDPSNRFYTITPDGVVLSVWLNDINDLDDFEYFAYFQPTAHDVFLSGNFLNWHDDALRLLPMADGPAGLFTAFVELKRPFSYKIIVDDIWVLENANPDAQKIIPDNLGGGNNAREVGDPPMMTFLRRQLRFQDTLPEFSAATAYAHIDVPYPRAPRDGADKELEHFLATGKTDMPNLIREYMDLYNAPIQLVREGKRMTVTDRFPYTSMSDPAPDTLGYSQTARVMAAGALMRATGGYTVSAVEDITAIMRMGYVLQQENSSILMHLIGIEVRETAAEAMRVLLENNDVSPDALQAYVDEVSLLSPKNDALSAALFNALDVAEGSLIETAEKPDFHPEAMEEEMRAAGFTEAAIRDSLEPENIRSDFEGLRAFFSRIDAMDAPERYQEGTELAAQLGMMISELNPMIQIAIPDFLGAQAAQDTARTLEHMNATAALLKLDDPKALNRFSDIFTGKPFEYYPTAAKPFRLRSPGPDSRIEESVQAYDRKKGVFSSGDLYFGRPR